MDWLWPELDGGSVRPDGTLLDQRGLPTGLQVVPGGYLILDRANQQVGTLALTGRIYNWAGNLVARVSRHDIGAPPPAHVPTSSV